MYFNCLLEANWEETLFSPGLTFFICVCVQTLRYLFRTCNRFWYYLQGCSLGKVSYPYMILVTLVRSSRTLKLKWVTIFGKVAETGMNTFVQVRVQIPSGLNIEAWKTYLENYAAKQIVQFFQSLIRITSKQTQNYNSERSRGFWGDFQFILSF